MTIGIYTISSSHSDRLYVGSSVNIIKRFKDHITKLIAGKHHSYKLQNHFNACKPILTLNIIDECDESELAPLEFFYINYYDAVNNGFNVTYDTRRRKPYG